VEHSTEPAVYGARLTTAAVFLENSIIVSNCEVGTVRLAGAHLGQFDAIGTVIRNESGPALLANGMQVEEVVYFDGLTAIGAGEAGAVNLTNTRLGGLDFPTHRYATTPASPWPRTVRRLTRMSSSAGSLRWEPAARLALTCPACGSRAGL
jgi:hypothetical protein